MASEIRFITGKSYVKIKIVQSF